MRLILALSTVAVLTACNSSSDSSSNEALIGYAIDDFVLRGRVVAQSLDGTDSRETETGEMGQFSFTGADALQSDVVYRVVVSGGVLDRDGLFETTEQQVDFSGQRMVALVKGGELNELIVNPITTGISEYVLENNLDYYDYQQLMDNLPPSVQQLNSLSRHGVSDLSELGYAIGHFTAAAAQGSYQIDGLHNLVDSLSDTGSFEYFNIITEEMAEHNARSALAYAAQSDQFITSAGQFAHRLDDDQEKVVVGLVPDTQGAGDNNSWLLQDGLMKHYADEGVELVLAVGDLTNSNTQPEYDNWLRVMNQYIDSDAMTVLPVRGNHETTWWTPDGGAQIYIDNVAHMVTEAEHLPGYEDLSYAYRYKNLLIIAVDGYIHDNPREYDSGKSAWVTTYPWMKQMVEKYRDEVDHIIVMTHEPMFGRARTGGWGKIDQATNVQEDGPTEYGIAKRKEIIKFLADNNITFVSGHDHQYSRAAILVDDSRDISVGRIKHQQVEYFDHIIAGNASYKEYATSTFAGAFDYDQSVHERLLSRHTFNGRTETGLNSSILSFQGNLIDYVAYQTPHIYTQDDQDIFEANEQWDAFDYDGHQWRKIDQFTKVKGAYTRIVDSEYSNQGGTDSVVLRTLNKDGYMGTEAILMSYINYTFDTYTNSGASSGNPYANIESRRNNLDTMLQFSYLSDEDNGQTVTDVLMVNGTQQQSGTETDAGGVLVPDTEDRFYYHRIEYDDVFDGYLYDQPGDLYALGFVVPEGYELDEVEPARYDEQRQVWVSEAYSDGFVSGDRAYSADLLKGGRTLPEELQHLTNQERYRINGVNTASRVIWFLSNRDGKFALVKAGTAELAM
ncbi:metallophosphoesterase family protein [Aliagarivorans marinus]|uniref:metallophosphoesterase family protein n=1 Tax=Aliagarivorans marinus TaxID=561965 RepID=UPI00040A53D2|nr:metallophosphoesterase [Aliagarivorans marinus]